MAGGRACYADLSASDISMYRTFFLTGERKGLTDECSEILLAPILNRDLALDYFLNSGFVPVTQQQILGNYFNKTNKASVIDWYEEHAKYVAEAFYGDLYEPFFVEEGRNTRDIAPNPDWFYEMFFLTITRVISKPKLYTGYMECIEYTLSLIPKMTGKYKPDEKKPDELIRAASLALSKKELPQRTEIFVKELLSKENEIKHAWAENSFLNTNKSR